MIFNDKTKIVIQSLSDRSPLPVWPLQCLITGPMGLMNRFTMHLSLNQEKCESKVAFVKLLSKGSNIEIILDLSTTNIGS